MNLSVGTFISMDTYSGSIDDPVSLHKYLYANSNPVMYSDPSGYMAGLLVSVGHFVQQNANALIIFAGLASILTMEVSYYVQYQQSLILSMIDDLVDSGITVLDNLATWIRDNYIRFANAGDGISEHTDGARPSTEEKHQKGQSRKKRDKGGEKGDKRRTSRKDPKKKVNYKGVAMDNLYQKLCLLCNEKKLIEIYNRNDDFNKFNLGVLISVNQTEYIYVLIDKQGRTDGIRLGFIDDLYRIVDESKYIDKYSKIMRDFGRELLIDDYEHFFNNDRCSLESFLQYSQDRNMVVSLSLCGSNQYDISGFVHAIEGDIITFKELNTYGELVTVSYINIDDIDYCSCDSEDERILKMLCVK